MCGIAGIVDLTNGGRSLRPSVRKMISMLAHRGPESAAVYEDAQASLAHARLSIIDLAGGRQPIPNESGDLWIICNGEFFNYIELRRSLLAKGHVFRTESDSEVLIHLYEEYGWQAVNELNGDFAFALWDRQKRSLLLGRDRMGVRPLFYAVHDGYFFFASEIKALFTTGMPRRPDGRALAQVFTTWSPLPGQTLFEGVQEVMPGCTLSVNSGSAALDTKQYWHLEYPPATYPNTMSDSDMEESIRQALFDSVEIRLRADVPVGIYLSGGLDSSLIAALARKFCSQPLHSFSITFTDPQFNESAYQNLVAQRLGTIHHIMECDAAIIRKTLPEVVWHTEVPLLRLSPVPMYLLSGLTQQNKLKVVLTGEGADEFFAGYDLFKEAQIRRFWSRDPDSKFRYRLLSRLYPDMPDLQRLPIMFLKSFFSQELTSTVLPYYSHLIRWHNTYRGASLFSKDLKHLLGHYDVVHEIETMLPGTMQTWSPLSQAQYLEVTTFLSTYLVSSQGDRVGMAHAIEGRYPFLDYRLIELSNKLPPKMKLGHLRGEKKILKRIAQDLIPDEVLKRPKRPYRAPIQSVFSGKDLPDYAADLLSPSSVSQGEFFDPGAVQALTRKVLSAPHVSEVEEMAFIGVLTYQLLHHQFVHDGAAFREESVRGITIDDLSGSSSVPA